MLCYIGKRVEKEETDAIYEGKLTIINEKEVGLEEKMQLFSFYKGEKLILIFY